MRKPTLSACLLLALILATTGPASADDWPFEEDSWLMVVLPDIQSYVDHSEHMHILNDCMDWISEHREQFNIALVLQEGDIVFQNGVLFAAQSSGNQNSFQQWRNARQAIGRVSDDIPVIMATGNHDYGRQNAENRNSRFSDYFRLEDFPLLDPAQGGMLADSWSPDGGRVTMENAIYDFTAPDGRKMLIVSLEWGPRAEIVRWADAVCSLPQYSGHTQLLLTHAYMYHDDTRYDWASKGDSQAANPYSYKGTADDTSDGEDLWNGLVRGQPLMQFVFSGHVGGDMVGRLTTPNDAGNDCHQMLFNAQFLPLGGEGWIRLLEFLPDGRTVHVRTYSPWFDNDGDEDTAAWRRGPDDDFVLELLPAG
ncbi:MAG: metallophosphoesterase [Planctomycetales bacterium]|nr:metallophosphoesterase [bacterium]UNM09735.1 MAG: metallophosphoesterase [Planctomycetales bacterium]